MIKIISDINESISPTTGGELYFSVLFNSIRLASSKYSIIFKKKKHISIKEILNNHINVALENFDTKNGLLVKNIIFRYLFKVKLVIYVRQVCYEIIKYTPEWYHAKYILNTANLIVTNSEYSKKWIMQFGVIENNIYISCPAPFKQEREKLEYKRKTNYEINSIVRIVYVANIRRIKRQFYAIKVLKELKDINIIFTFIGLVKEESYKKEIMDYMIKYKMENKVIFKGFTDKVKLIENLISSDIVFYPADREGYGISLVEALSLGLPVVAANAGANSELIEDGENGVLFESDNIKESADKIRMMINNHKLRKEIGDRAYLKARKYKQWDQVSAEMLEKFNEISV